MSSVVNFTTGQTTANLVLTKLSSSGQIDITNKSGGPADFILDTAGYLPG